MATQTPTTATAPLGSTARTNQLLSESSKQTGVPATTFNIDTPSQVSANVSKGLSTPANPGGNPLDAPGATPTAQPGKNLDGTAVGSNPVQPSPQNPLPPATTQTNQTGTNTQSSQELSPTDQVPQALADQVGQAQSATDLIAQQHKQALADLTKSGVTPPSSAGSASAGIQTALNAQPQPQQEPETPAAVTSFFDPTNPVITDQMQALQDIISPPAQRQSLVDAMSQLKTDQSSLSGLKTDLMNIKRVMAGSQQDIMDEVTKAGGTISQSLLDNMTIARNRALVTQSQLLTDQVQTAQDAVATDTTLVGDEKQMAAQEFTQRMSLVNFMQTNYDNQMNAAKQSIDTLLKTPGGLAAYASDPVQAARAEQVMGYAPGTIAQLNTASQQATALDTELKQAQLANTQANTAKTNADLSTQIPGTPSYNANQDKLEQQYRTVLLKEASNRSGDLGIQNNKVSQAIHLTALLNQYKDAKGNYNVPTAQYAELAMGLASLISPSGSAESDRQAIMSKTASGDLKGAIQYITGTPQNGNTQAIIKNLADSIDRQGSTAEDLRNEQVNFLQGLVPTGLDQSRVDALNANSLPSYATYKSTGKVGGTTDNIPKLLAPTDIPTGYYQASDGLLYKK